MSGVPVWVKLCGNAAPFAAIVVFLAVRDMNLNERLLRPQSGELPGSGVLTVCHFPSQS